MLGGMDCRSREGKRSQPGYVSWFMENSTFDAFSRVGQASIRNSWSGDWPSTSH